MIGIIGGTFDPIHIGHLRLALEVSEQLSLKEMRFIPSATPPHRWQPVASAEHRLAMVKLAIQDTHEFGIDDREYRREGASYTVDTLKSIRQEIGKDTSLCLLLGLDAFQSFTQWHDWQGILELTHLVISSRPGYDEIPEESWMKERLTKTAEDLSQKPAGMLFYADVSQLDISATIIRKQLKNGNSSRYLTTNAVHDYILKNKLYR